jgi:hypothetical protein
MRAFLDASEVTINCQRMSRSPSLNGLWAAEIRLASQYASITEGVTELVITDNGGGTVLHAGPCWYGEDDGGANDQISEVISYDWRVVWPWRQVMDFDGDFSDPSIFQDFEEAPLIMAAAVNHSIANDGAMGTAVGSFFASSVPLVGFKPTDWPWSLQYLWEFLVSTGELDIMLNPATGGASTLDFYSGDAGTDLSGSVVFDYNTGSFNCTGAKYTFDLKNTISRIRYFLGPKRPQYRGDIQHWAGDVQIDDPDLDVPPFATKQTEIDSRSGSIESDIALMRDTRVYDAVPKEAGGEIQLKPLYLALWQSEMMVRTVPRRYLVMTPEPGFVPAFEVADIVTANAVIRGTVGGAQRVYRFTVEQDTEGNEMLTELVTSGDQDF